MKKFMTIAAGVAAYAVANRVVSEVDTRIESKKSYWKATDELYDLADLNEYGVGRGKFHVAMEFGACIVMLPLLPLMAVSKLLGTRIKMEEE